MYSPGSQERLKDVVGPMTRALMYCEMCDIRIFKDFFYLKSVVLNPTASFITMALLVIVDRYISPPPAG